MTLEEIIKADADLCGAVQACDLDKYIEVLTAKRDELNESFEKVDRAELATIATAQLKFTLAAIEAGKITTQDGLFAFLGFGPPPKRLIDAAREGK